MMNIDKLKEFLQYDQDTGIFYWRVSRGRAKAGSIAGSIDGNGYLSIKIDGQYYLQHRLAWLFAHRAWPNGHIDHIDQDKNNNRISNLRIVNCSENQQNRCLQKNNTSGFKGVQWNKNVGRWQAAIQINRKKTHLGLFDSAEIANAAYLEAASKMHTHQPIAITAARARLQEKAP